MIAWSDLDMFVFARTAALVFGSLALLALVDLTLGTALRNRRHRRERSEVKVAFGELVSLSEVPAKQDMVVTALARLPDHVVEEALMLASRTLGGSDATRFGAAAEALGVNRRARRALRSRRWWRRLRAVRLLTMTSAEAPAWHLFRDRDPDVRAAAALWTGSLLAGSERPDVAWTSRGYQPREVAERLSEGLLDRAALVRLAAKHAVGEGGPVAVDAVEGALRRTLWNPITSGLSPIAPLAAAATLTTPIDAALIEPHLTHPDPRVRAAALRAAANVLPDRLVSLCARGVSDDVHVRVATASVAGRHLDTVHHLVVLADDPAWQVRQVARTSLQHLGPVGRALLRRVQREAVA